MVMVAAVVAAAAAAGGGGGGGKVMVVVTAAAAAAGDGFVSFETTAIKRYPSFRGDGAGLRRTPGLRMLPFAAPLDVVRAAPMLEPLFA